MLFFVFLYTVLYIYVLFKNILICFYTIILALLQHKIHSQSTILMCQKTEIIYINIYKNI